MICNEPGQCWTGIDGCALSQPGTICIECVDAEKGYGWLNGTKCEYETFVFKSLDRIVPVSECGLRKCRQGSRCVDSKFGARCEECSRRGYVERDPLTLAATCVCYDSKYDGNAACQTLYEDAYEIKLVRDAYESVTCESWQNRWMGFYKPVPASKYGAPNPPIPDSCVFPYGPPPFAIAEEYPPYTACATLGGPDPNEAYGIRRDFSFQTCSGHGTWDALEHKCTCDANWDRALTGAFDYYDGAVSTCETCVEGWGPIPPRHDPLNVAKLPPYCVVPYVEDFDGIRKECSGHGEYAFGSCVCYASEIKGYWNHTMIDGIQTCAVCADGYGPPRDCRFGKGQEQITTRPTTKQPTSGPIPRESSCEPCFYRFQDVGEIIGGVTVFPSINQSSCVDSCELKRENEFVLVSCANSTFGLASLGYEMCDNAPGCDAFAFSAISNDTFAFRFVSAPFQIFYETQSWVWSLACVTTSKPTSNPTAYPTAYPTLALSGTTRPTTRLPTTREPTTEPTSLRPTTFQPSTLRPSAFPSFAPTQKPTTRAPTTRSPTTRSPTTRFPTTLHPSLSPSRFPTKSPSITPTISVAPTKSPTRVPTRLPTTRAPTFEPTTRAPTTRSPTTLYPTLEPSTRRPTSRPTFV